ncbi:MAG TPA: hypothetical protein VF463_01270 [Sphingobium sp.]
MNEYSHRNSPVAPVSSATDRVSAIARIAPVEPMTAQAGASQDRSQLPRIAPEAVGDVVHHSDEQARSHADYARVQEEIATILSGLDASPARDNGEALGQAENALASLMPQPSIVLPLPPASDAMVAFIHQVRQSILTQDARTRAAMSNVSAATVEAATAAA